MDPQIIQYNRMIYNEQYKKAELYHKGIKYGEYYRLLKRIQRYLIGLYLALTSLMEKLKRQRHSKSVLVEG